MIQKLYGTSYTDNKVEDLELKVKKYQDKLSSCTYMVEILESLMLVENIWKLLKNMNIFLKNVDTFSWIMNHPLREGNKYLGMSKNQSWNIYIELYLESYIHFC